VPDRLVPRAERRRPYPPASPQWSHPSIRTPDRDVLMILTP